MILRSLLILPLLGLAACSSSTSTDYDRDGYPDDIDCEPQDASAYPGAADPYGDSKDTNCDGIDGVDSDGDGYPAGVGEGMDCEDSISTAHPGADEVAGNAIDDDCDGQTDEPPGDDDDDTGDDDDDTGDDDDDTGDDDDDSLDEGDPVEPLGSTYCLDWSSVQWTSPPNFDLLLQGSAIDLEAAPLVMQPTLIGGGDDESFEGLLAQVTPYTCIPMVPGTQTTVDLSGEWHPLDEMFWGEADTDGMRFAGMEINDLSFTGYFSAGGHYVVQGTYSAEVAVPDTEEATVCVATTCVDCSSGVGQCLDVVGDSLRWTWVGDHLLTDDR